MRNTRCNGCKARWVMQWAVLPALLLLVVAYPGPGVARPATLAITTEALPDGDVGLAYGATVASSGGTAPLTWSVSADSLPRGLTLAASTGRISGTPTVSGPFTFTIRAQDGSTPPQSATRQYTFTIRPEVLLADTRNHRIVRFNDMPGTGWAALGTSAGRGANQFNSPARIFMDGAGRIYVADGGNHRIIRMDDMTGAGWTTHGTFGSDPNQFRSPTDVFVDGAGRIYVTEHGNSRIIRMNDMTGAGWTTLGTFGSGANQFRHLAGVFVDGAGRIYVADGNGRIARMNDMTGAGWTTHGTSGSGANQFNDPVSVFVDGQGRIYVADRKNHRIVRFNDMTGAGWTVFGGQGGGANQFHDPLGIFVR